MKKSLIKYVSMTLMLLVGSAMLTSCGASGSSTAPNLNFLSPNETYEKQEASDYHLVNDRDELYMDDDEVQVVYLTVGQGSSSDGTNHTWKEVNAKELSWYSDRDIDPYKCEAILQFGNEVGPIMGRFGYGVTSANATVRLSGEGASEKQQKSYRVNIKSGDGSVDGMKTVVLSKSFSDPFRFVNKLCYELMEDIPSMLSTRTSFVHLYVKDVTESRDTKFVDYGLYTMVEPINKKYLSNRYLDNTGELYKIVDFNWMRHKTSIVQPTDADYDKERFEKLLESKGGNDYSKLIAALDAVNDDNIPIEDIIDTYFDADNLFTWMAFNILTDNKDTDLENYYIYSPVGTDKFYIISWDNDGALRSDYRYLQDEDYDPGWQTGAFIYHESQLFRRVLESESCVNRLSDKVSMLHEGVLSADHVMEKANAMASIVKPYLYDLPDMSFARVTKRQYDDLLEKLAEQIDNNYYAYYDSIDGPWPFHILEPVTDNGHIIINWDESSAVGMDVVYNIQIDEAWDFKNPIVEASGIRETTFDAGKLAKGQYFVRVTAVSDNGHEQSAIQFYNTEKKTRVNGVLCFYVMEDGSVVESTFN